MKQKKYFAIFKDGSYSFMSQETLKQAEDQKILKHFQEVDANRIYGDSDVDRLITEAERGSK